MPAPNPITGHSVNSSPMKAGVLSISTNRTWKKISRSTSRLHARCTVNYQYRGLTSWVPHRRLASQGPHTVRVSDLLVPIEAGGRGFYPKFYGTPSLRVRTICFLLLAAILQSVSGPDLVGGDPGDPGPRPPTIEGPHTKLLIFYFLLMNQLMTSL